MKKYFILILLTLSVMGCESRFSERPEDDKTLLWPAANNTGDSVGFINAEGKMVIPAVYSQAHGFCGGKAAVSRNGIKYYIDKRGKQVSSLPADLEFYDSYFYYGYCRIQNSTGRYGMCNSDFDVVIPAEYDDLGMMTKDGLAYFYPNKYSIGWGYLNQQGEVAIEPKFWVARDFWDGVAVVGFSTASAIKYGAINTRGELVIDTVYQDLISVGSGVIAYQPNNSYLYGLMTTDGEILTEPMFYSFSFFGDCDLMPVRKEFGGPWGYVDKTGQMRIDFRYFSAYPFYDNVAWVIGELDETDEYGLHHIECRLIDAQGNEILALGTGNGGPLINPKSNFHNGLCCVCFYNHKNEYQYINKKGEIIYSWPYGSEWNPNWHPVTGKHQQILDLSKLFEGTPYYPLAIQSQQRNEAQSIEMK